MGRPKQYQSRSSTGIRMSPELHERLRKACEERDVTMNWMTCRAIEYYLDRLIPVEEIKWVKD